jgi:hypothetical protein
MMMMVQTLVPRLRVIFNAESGLTKLQKALFAFGV